MARKSVQIASPPPSGNSPKNKPPRDSKSSKNAKRSEPEQTERRHVSTSMVLLVSSLALICGVIHWNHVWRMFEREKHFSHLSNLERELSFRTEMGLYYSYYKTIIQAPTFWNGMEQVMRDNVTEYPATINVLKRFNLFPEVVVGALFRVFTSVSDQFKIRTKECWTVNRGEGLSPVLSCEGIGDPMYFYVHSVFFLHGICMALVFLLGSFLSQSVWGGLLSVLCFFYNHGEATRVQWTPPLRESWSYPLHTLQMLVVTLALSVSKPGRNFVCWIALTTITFMLPWQFAQFSLATQTLSLIACYMLKAIDSVKLKAILYGQVIGLAVSFVFMFGNLMLLTSLFSCVIVGAAVILAAEPVLSKMNQIVQWILQLILLVLSIVGVKKSVGLVLGVADDAHIFDILRSKFSDYRNFHTMLYTCAKEFDFLELETYSKLSKTLLLPLVAMVVLMVSAEIARGVVAKLRKPDSQQQTNKKENEEVESDLTEQAPVIYHLFQLAAYTVMAVAIMRLKLFWTPQLCIMASLICSKKYFGWLHARCFSPAVLAIVIGAAMTIGGMQCLKEQFAIFGEYHNTPLEQLVEWVNVNTPREAVFAGSMPTMANLKLSTERAIVNHPHYEDEGLRERTVQVYSIFSRKPLNDVHQRLKTMGVQYVIIEDNWCRSRPSPGCGMADIWDVEDPANAHKKITACVEMAEKPEPYFRRVFKNQVYDVFAIVADPTAPPPPVQQQQQPPPPAASAAAKNLKKN